MEERIGIVERVIYNNAENGYTVVDLDSGGELLTAVGIFPPISEGEQLLLTGEMKFNSHYGEQFAVESVKISPPSGIISMQKYLACGLFKGVGDVTAAAIATYFGDKTLDVIENNPSLLSKVKGVSVKKAQEIGDTYRANREMQEAIIYLQSLDLTTNMAIKIYKKYGANTTFVMDNNPYKLVEDVDGIGFITADKIARKMGIDTGSVFRIKAGIIFTLRENAGSKGNTCMPMEMLLHEVLTLLQLGEDYYEDINGVIKEMLLFDDLRLVECEDAQFVMLSLYYNLEHSIAKKVNALLRAPDIALDYVDVTLETEQFERSNGITLHEKQKQAIAQAINSGCMIITGGPGTGKTTIIRCIISILKNKGLEYALCAPTGRAAKRMSEATGAIAKTIHRMLDLCFNGNVAAFTYNEDTRLSADVVIVDEVSMCDEYIFNALIKALKAGSRLLLIGDADQLPSVGAGNVLMDLIESGLVPLVKLSHIYRQSNDSLIVDNAHRINEGKFPILDNSKRDFFFLQRKDATEIYKSICDLVTKRLPDYYGINPKEIQVLAPLKKGLSGVNNLNKELQRTLNPLQKGCVEYTLGDETYRVGDKVIHTVNNYQMKWERVFEEDGAVKQETGFGVFNGDIGYIEEIDKAEMSVTVRFDDGRVSVYPRDAVDQLHLAYAISVHKSQGSEFNTVVISLMSGGYMIMTRNLLYTAVTRAKNMLVIVGDEEILKKMVRNTFSVKSFSLLTKFLLEEAAQ